VKSPTEWPTHLILNAAREVVHGVADPPDSERGINPICRSDEECRWDAISERVYCAAIERDYSRSESRMNWNEGRRSEVVHGVADPPDSERGS
jgi:hypothetical protein